MKIVLFVSILSVLAVAQANESWVVLNDDQQEIVSRDICAKAAVDAGAALVSEEIQDAGVDYPDHLYLLDLQVSEPGLRYGVTFRDDVKMIIKTKRSGSTCMAEKPARFEPQDGLSISIHDNL